MTFAQHQASIAAALADGLSYNSLGFSFPGGIGNRTSWKPYKGVARGLEREKDSEDQQASIEAVLHHDVDPRAYEASLTNPWLAELVLGLRRDGFYCFNRSWGFGSPLRSNGTHELIMDLLDGVRPRPELGGNAALPAGRLPAAKLSRLTNRLREVLDPAARAYLGPDSSIGGMHAYRLPAHRIDETRYQAAMWHHDRCGARLKAYLLLHDVDHQAHPMRLAKASHRTVYYRYNDVASSRFADSYVERAYETVTLTGRMGEGFVFDTNALHRATIEGSRSRSALMLEMNAAEKSGKLRASAHAPCPTSMEFLQPLAARVEHRKQGASR